MTEQYTQTIETAVSRSDKIKLISGIAIMMLSLIFLVVAVLKNHLFFIGFAILLAIGFVFVEMFESAPSGYTYSLSSKSIIISKTNNAHRTKRIAWIKIENIVRIEQFCDFKSKDDIVACEVIGDYEVYQIVFHDAENGAQYKRILFKPDGYMIAMLKELLNGKFLGGAAEE